MYTSIQKAKEEVEIENRAIARKYGSISDPGKFYEKFREDQSFVSHSLFSRRDLKKNGIKALTHISNNASN